jgi:two-component system sensor histidine kinase DesK
MSGSDAPTGAGTSRWLAPTVSLHDPCLTEEARRHFTARWRLFGGVFLIFLVESVHELWVHDSVPVRVLGLALIAVYVALFMVAAPRAAFGGSRGSIALALGGMTAVVVVYLVVCGSGGLSMLPYLAVVGAMVSPLPLVMTAGLLLGFAVASAVLPQYVSSWDIHSSLADLGIGVLLAGSVALIMRYTASTSSELDLAREEIERLGAEQERLRIARDLHDLLGHALTTVTMKAELASRLVAVDPDRAAEEMREVAELSRESLSDVRATVAGYREMSLAAELITAREILAAAGIQADLPASTEVVPGELRELFGWTLREGVTNAVRHSRARHVEVRFEPRAIEVVNDGVVAVNGNGSAPAAEQGSGLAGLSERASKLGAHLLAGPDGPSAYRLRVEVP